MDGPQEPQDPGHDRRGLVTEVMARLIEVEQEVEMKHLVHCNKILRPISFSQLLSQSHRFFTFIHWLHVAHPEQVLDPPVQVPGGD